MLFEASLNLFAHKILVFTYHKSGTVLFEQVMGRIAAGFGLQVRTLYGRVAALDDATDITIIAHSLLALSLPPNFRGVRIIRDPRDIWVSGYLYHRRCNEGWCVNVDTIPRESIGYPQVPFSMLHLPEWRKLDFLQYLAGRSYQQNLLERDAASGLAFELGGYTGVTLDAMRTWQPHPDILDVKLETLAADYDATIMRMFSHLGLDAAQRDAAVALAGIEDVARMDDATIESRGHIVSRRLSKWQEMLTTEQVLAFERLHGDLIAALGYGLVTQSAGITPGATAAYRSA